MSKTEPVQKGQLIYDPIYGFIKLTPIEWDIIHSPFYQRLRWIKQLGFSCYTFHGAEHSRFGHSIGVMFNAHKILQSVGCDVSEDELEAQQKSGTWTKERLFHQTLRLSALLHDLGTFPFSHTVEMSYVNYGETTNNENGKGLKDNHEHLGSFIIKNTDYEGGITHILKEYNIDPQLISDLVKGTSESVLANQILHSEIDCDRMDYLLRDAYYTGLNYGTYDRDYLLHHFRVEKINERRILAIKINALHCVEDFLTARFAWYSQVVRSARGAKYDAIAEVIGYHMLENDMIYKYSDLLDLIMNKPEEFYAFNDMYFMNKIHSYYYKGDFDKFPKIKDMVRCLMFEHSPRVIRCEEFKQRLISQDKKADLDKVMKKSQEKVQEIKDIIKKKGKPEDWVIFDLPKKNIVMAKSKNQLIKDKTEENVLLERDPVKIEDNGEVKLLTDIEHSIIANMTNYLNYIPNAFCSDSVYQLLIKEGVITE